MDFLKLLIVMNKKTIVSIVQGENVEENVQKALDLINVENIIHENDSVLIKPNLSAGLSPALGETTKLEVIEAVVKRLKSITSKEIAIGESSGVTSDTKEVYKKLGYDTLAQKLHIKLIDFDNYEFIQVRVKNPMQYKTLRISKALLEYNKIISIPVLKTHSFLLSCAIKNMFGVIPDEDKMRIHKDDKVEEALVDLNLTRKADLIIVDGIIGSEGLAGGIGKGKPIKMNLILSGKDPVAVDSVAAKIIGINPELILHIKWAAEKGVGVMDPKMIKIRGKTIEEVSRKFKTHLEQLSEELPTIKVINENACTGCISKLSYILSEYLTQCKKRGFKPNKKIRVFLGKNVKEIRTNNYENIVIIGDCLKNFFYKGHYIPGCPVRISDCKKIFSEIFKEEIIDYFNIQ